MDYDAITLDTNIFDQNGLKLKDGLLSQLTQFSEGDGQFVLSEIVIREVFKHLTDKYQETNNQLTSGLRKALGYNLITKDESEQIEEIYKPIKNAKAVAQEHVEKYLEQTGGEVVPAAETDIKELVNSYFATKAPFEGTGKKKNEFPDAIALLSLENWAKNHNKKILAISDDGGWINFARKSHWIDVEKDLATALQSFQEHSDAAREVILQVFQDIADGHRWDFNSYLQTILEEAVDIFDVYPEATAAYHYEPDCIYFSVTDFEYLADELQIVQTGRELIVVKLPIEVQIRAECDFSFSVKDGIDKDYVQLGSTHATKDESHTLSMLIRFIGNFDPDNPDDPDIDIGDAELIDSVDHIDFGEIEIDWSEEAYEE